MKLTRAAITVVLAVALVATPIGAEAQPGRKLPRIGFLTWQTCPSQDSVFVLALRDLGHRWGQTVQVVCRSAEGDHRRLAAAAAALPAEKVDIIAALTHVTAYAARRATHSIPIVMIASGDPVRTGLVISLGRPGGNVTGLTYYATDLVEKRLVRAPLSSRHGPPRRKSVSPSPRWPSGPPRIWTVPSQKPPAGGRTF